MTKTELIIYFYKTRDLTEVYELDGIPSGYCLKYTPRYLIEEKKNKRQLSIGQLIMQKLKSKSGCLENPMLFAFKEGSEQVSFMEFDEKDVKGCEQKLLSWYSKLEL